MKTGQRYRAGARLTFGVMSQKRTEDRRIYRFLQVLFSTDDVLFHVKETIKQLWLQWGLDSNRKPNGSRLGRLHYSCFRLIAYYLALPYFTLAGRLLRQDKSFYPVIGGV